MPLNNLLRSSNAAEGTSWVARRRRATSDEPARSMELDDAARFEVVAEILPAGSIASSCSSDGQRDGQQDDATSRARAMPRSDSSGAIAQQASNSDSLPVLLGTSAPSGHPATARALRARGKAMLRTQSGLPGADAAAAGLQHACSCDSSSSFERAVAPIVGSPRYMRAATAPLPRTSGGLGSSAGLAVAAPAADAQLEDDDELQAPCSPAAGAAHDEHEHCEWEDGTVAAWLQLSDHGLGEALHDAPQPPPPAAASAAVAYASLLYN